MKKQKLFPGVLCMLLLSLSACSNEEDFQAEESTKEVSNITMTASDFEYPETRTDFVISQSGAEFKWAANDTVGIFPNEGSQVYFPMTSGAGTNSASFTGGGWALKSSATYAAYYPFIGDMYLKQTKIPVSYVGQMQTGNSSTAHLGAYDFMAASATTAENGGVNFRFKHLGCLVQLNITVPNAGTLSSVILSSDEEVFMEEGYIDLTAATPAIVSTKAANSMTINLKDVTVENANDIITVYFMIAPVDMTGKTFNATLKDLMGNEETIALAVSNFEAGKAYQKHITATAVPVNMPHYKVTTAGTLSTLISEAEAGTLTEVKISGPLNGTDIRFIREKMAGCEIKIENTTSQGTGALIALDLSDATIVEGGEPYYSNYSIENNVLGACSFYKSNTLVSVVLPKSITKIGSSAFSECSDLTSVIIPNSVTRIRSYAFSRCNLNEIVIPEGVETIEGYAFAYNANLKSVTIPQSVTRIYDNVFFNYNNGGMNVYIQDLQKFMDVLILAGSSNVFYSNYYRLFLNNKEVNDLTISTNVPNLARCESLVSVTLLEGAYFTFGGAFEKCTNLTQATLPNCIQKVVAGSFADSGLKTITIGNNVKSIDYCAFLNCPLNTFYSYTQTPPDIDVIYEGMDPSTLGDRRYSFYGVNKDNATLYVPKGCKAAYESSDWAKHFGTIVEME